VRLGGWLFKYRTSLPLPIAAALLLIPAQSVPFWVVWLGLGFVILGEWLRFQGVRHIGAISRTRSDRLGPLVSSGPFAWVRNPLYLGNIALWVGFALSARLAWLAPIVAIVLFAEYHAIVLWEEALLEARVGQAYGEYAHRVPRWVPRTVTSRKSQVTSRKPIFSWRETLFSERGTLLAIAAGYALLYLKARLTFL
jgi:protein-S-isoprenylcysteine O-methyltransferase Ste14